MLTYLLPTRDRPARLAATLRAIGSLSAAAHAAIGGAEVIIVDNASDPPVNVEVSLANGMPVRVIRRDSNEGAAARNIGAQAARGEWIVMLDDDSYPLDAQHIALLLEADEDVAAMGANIALLDGKREAGGLPEVFVGCGVALRRQAFLDAGGYDPSFDYYVEEYDLCAKLILNGWRIVHDLRFRVRHEKISVGRDMNRILWRLVRNNGWVAQRYAPAAWRQAELEEIVSRYGRIAMKENAAEGYSCGMSELLQTLDRQPHREMSIEQFDRFTVLTSARSVCERLSREGSLGNSIRVAIVDEGKNCWAVRQALVECGARLVKEPDRPDVRFIGTLSPGPMLDAFQRRMSLGENVMMPANLHGHGAEFAGAACA